MDNQPKPSSPWKHRLLAIGSAIAFVAGVVPAAAPIMASIGLGATAKLLLAGAGFVGAIITEKKHLAPTKPCEPEASTDANKP